MKASYFSGELLGCPFCGGMAEEHWPNSTTQHFVQCEVCGARTSTSLASHGGSAKDEWNRRAQPLPEKHELACVPETAKSDTQAGLPIVDETQGTWSDGGKEWTPDKVSFKAGWDKAKQLLKPEDLDGFDKAAARITELEQALREIEELNKLDPDENGYRWDNSDLVAQTIMSALRDK